MEQAANRPIDTDMAYPLVNDGWGDYPLPDEDGEA